MIRYMRPSLVRQFLGVLQNDGIRSAVGRARDYIRARRGGAAPGQVPRVPSAPSAPGAHYLTGVWQTLAQSDAFHVTAAPACHTKRRKIALIGDLNLPQCRKYRVEQLVQFWQTQGVDLGFAHYQDVPRAVHLLQDATHLMLYRLPRCADVSMYLYEARRLRLPILYDIDDPLFSVSAYETYENMTVLDPGMRAHFAAEAPRYLDVMNASDVISVSTPGLVDHARLYTHRPVYLRRNFADSATLDAGRAAMRARAAPGPDDPFRVVFASGSRGHEADFAIIAGTLSAFLQGGAGRRLTILGHFDPTLLPDAMVSRTDWQAFTGYDQYLAALAQADCALMPLTDDPFNRCKSAVRAIDAAAVGVPVICSDVGDFANVVSEGQTGFIARTPRDWAAALAELARDPGGAQAMGTRARHALERRWVAQDAPHIADAALLDWVRA